MRKFLAGLLLAVASTQMYPCKADAAPAATMNPYAAWACGATRPSAEHTLTRATVITLDSRYLSASCVSRSDDVVTHRAPRFFGGGVFCILTRSTSSN